jgi:hypothetical protein
MATAAAFNGGNTPQAWFRRSRKRGPKGNASSLKFYERVAASARSLGKSVIKPTRRRVLVDLSHEAVAVLEPANRINAETPTKAPPMMQNVCRQIAEGIASWVTLWISA